MKLSKKIVWVARETKEGWRLSFWNGNNKETRYNLKGFVAANVAEVRRVVGDVNMIFIWLTENKKRNKIDREFYKMEVGEGK